MTPIFNYIQRKSNFIKSQDGFSLLEILVATAVSSLILLLVYTAHRSIMLSINDLTGIADFYEHVNLAVNRLDEDISSAYYDRYNKDLTFIGENDYSGKNNGRIDFVCVDHNELSVRGKLNQSNPVSDIKEIGYFLKRQDLPDKKGNYLFNLVRREQIHYDNEPQSGGDESIILENIVDAKFEFRIRNRWTDKWDSRKYRKFPSAVQTTLIVRNYRGNDEEFVFVSYINMGR